MKKLIIFFTLLAHLASAQSSKQIVIGHIDNIKSKILKEKRDIWVYVPKSYHKGSKQRYPVVYLLDGDSHFTSVVGMIEQFSTVNGNMLCPEMIVVGIFHNDRTRELTPTLPTDTVFRKEMPTAGGGEAFTSFLETELTPYINAHYPTQPFKLLIGHSLGGLMVVNTLMHHPNLFNAYICIDPSMWWEKGQFLEKVKQALASQTYPNKSFYLGLANNLPPDMTIQQVRTDTTWRTQVMRYNLGLMDALESNRQNGLRYQGKYYDNDDHGSVPLITEYDALRFIFKPYALTIPDRLKFSPTFNADSAIVAYYQGLSRQVGYAVLPPEMLVNRWGYEYLARGSQFLETAGVLFKLNVVNYPRSANVYDSYGDYFLMKGDTTTAIVNFKKALALKELAEWRQKLTALQAKGVPKPSPADKSKR